MPLLSGYVVAHPPLAVHEVGRGDEEKIRASLDSYDRIARDIAMLRPDTLVITSPHAPMYRDYFHISPGKGARGDFGAFRASQVSFDVSYDQELSEAIRDKCDTLGFPAGFEGERDPSLDHGVMVPLYFIDKYYRDYSILRTGLSGLPLREHVTFGKIIAAAAESLGRRWVFIASGDLSHCQKEEGPYGYSPEGPEYDSKLMEVLKKGDLEELAGFDELFLEKAEECGHRSFCIMSGAFGGGRVCTEVLSHEATFGVGYGFAIIRPARGADSGGGIGMKEAESGDGYVALARKTIETYIRENRVIKIPDNLDSSLTGRRAGAFVSIHEHGMLRGCIGTISAVRENLAQEIISNAVSASTEDPRFPPITEEELPYLEINVDVLSEAEDIESPDQLDVKRYGVIVTNGYRRGLLLPDLEGVDSVEEQIDIARRKAGIGANEKISLQRFEVIRHR